MKKLDDFGFSLLEVLMALSILGMISLGVMKLSEMSNKTSKSLGQKMDTVQLMNLVMPAFMDSNACQRSFVNETLANGANALDQTGGLRNKDGTVLLANPGAAGFKYGDILLERVVFANLQPASTSVIQMRDPLPPNNLINVVERRARVRFDIRKGTTKVDQIDRSQTMGVLNNSRSIPVTFYVRNDVTKTNVVGCYGNDTAFASAACSMFQGTLEAGICKSITVGKTNANNRAAVFNGNVEIAAAGTGAGAAVGRLSVGLGALATQRTLCLENATDLRCISSWNVQANSCQTIVSQSGNIENYLLSCPNDSNGNVKFAIAFGIYKYAGAYRKTLTCCAAKVR